VVSNPDLVGRKKILEVHAKKTPLAKEVDLERIARGTPGFSGADLESLVNEAALLAARTNKNRIDMDDLEKAKDKVLMGAERKSMVISEEDKRITAYHEAGHALVGLNLKGVDPIHKVTIIPRGMALGLTQTLPEKEQLNLSKSRAENMLAFLFGGRAAEEIMFSDFTTGAGNDIERATSIARRMVCEWGMSEKLGPLKYERREGPVFMGMQNQQAREYSDSKAEEIDAEVFRLVTTGYSQAKQLIHDHMDQLHAIAKALLEFETIDASEIEILVNGGSLEQIGASRKSRAQTLKTENATPPPVIDEPKEDDEGGDTDPVGNQGPVTA
jgi:cell division protease FtsH